MTARKPKSRTVKERKGGMPPHAPTDAMRTKVKVMVAAGLSHERIGAVVELDPKTLRKYYRKELDCGRDEALCNNTALLMNEARGGNVTAMIYVQKCLGGPDWRERQHVEQTGEQTLIVRYEDDDDPVA